MRFKRQAPTSDWRVELTCDTTVDEGVACVVSAKALIDSVNKNRLMRRQSDRMVVSLFVLRMRRGY
jgi:hypothetical protein